MKEHQCSQCGKICYNRLKCKNCYLKNLYHRSPSRRELMKRLTYKWIAEHPERWQEILNKAVKKFQQRPEYKELARRNFKKWYQRLKANPIAYAKHLKERREKERKRRLKASSGVITGSMPLSTDSGQNTPIDKI